MKFRRIKAILPPGIAVVASLALFVLVLVFRESPVKAGEIIPLASRTEDEQRTIDVYRKTNEAVVFITTITLEIDPYDIFLQARPKQGTGSGVIIDAAKGIIITNLHVIGNADKIEITLYDGLNYRAKLLGYDAESDLAVLQLRDRPKRLSAVSFADSTRLEVGQRVLAIGNPFGLNRTLTAGIISSVNRSVQEPGRSLLKGLIQTDAAINPGNSGGPLLDTDGRLIGINTAILSQSGDSAGIGFAIPINQIKKILPELIATGKVLRPRMGWVLQDTDQGPYVLRVLPGGPAEQGGIQPVERRVKDVFLRGYVSDYERGDLVVAINGKNVTSSDEVEDFIASQQGGKSVSITVRQGGMKGQERSLNLTPILQ